MKMERSPQPWFNYRFFSSNREQTYINAENFVLINLLQVSTVGPTWTVKIFKSVSPGLPIP